MYFLRYILAKKKGLSQKECNQTLFGLPVLSGGAAYIEKTVTGNPVVVTDALARNAKSLKVTFTPKQDGEPWWSEERTDIYQTRSLPVLAKPYNRESFLMTGLTVNWNQMVLNGDLSDGTTGWDPVQPTTTSISVADGIITMTALINPPNVYTLAALCTLSTTRMAGHKYLFEYDVKAEKPFFIYDSWTTGTTPLLTANQWNHYSTVWSSSADSSANRKYFGIGNYSDFAQGDSFQLKKCAIFDLTAMFGSTVADYIYAKEQANAGDGVAIFRKLFPDDYYAYSENTLISSKPTALVAKKNSTTVSTTDLGGVELRGLLTVSNNELVVNGDTYESDGTVTRNYGIVDLGSLTWTKNATGQFYSSLLSFELKSNTTNMLLSNAKYTISATGAYTPVVDGCITAMVSRVWITDSSMSTGAELKASLDGVYLLVELATPTTESASAYTNPHVVDATGTEEFTDNRTVPMPVGVTEQFNNVADISGRYLVSVNHAVKNYALTAVKGWMDASGADDGLDGWITEYIPINGMFTALAIAVTNKTANVTNVRLAVYDDNKQFVRMEVESTVNANARKSISKVLTDGTGFARLAIEGDSNEINNCTKNNQQIPMMFFDYGEIYGGVADIVSGEVEVTWGHIASYNSETLPGEWISSMDIYEQGTTPTIGAEVAYVLAEPITVQLTAQEVTMLLDDNILTTNDGTITLTYYAKETN